MSIEKKEVKKLRNRIDNYRAVIDLLEEEIEELKTHINSYICNWVSDFRIGQCDVCLKAFFAPHEQGELPNFVANNLDLFSCSCKKTYSIQVWYEDNFGNKVMKGDAAIEVFEINDEYGEVVKRAEKTINARNTEPKPTKTC